MKSAKREAEDQLRLLVRSNPAVWLETYGYIRDASGRKLRPAINILQRRINALYVEHLKRGQPLRSIGLKPRKRGYSTMVAAIQHAQINNYRHEGVIIGNKLETSDTVYRMMVYCAQNDGFKGEWGSPFAATTERLNYEHGGRVIQDTAKNGESIRGMTPQFIHGTEVAHWENAGEVMVALLNAIPDTGFNCVFLESTPKGSNGEFYNIWQKARWPNDDECPIGQKDYWKQWESLCPNQDREAGGLSDYNYVRVFAAWYEFEDAKIPLSVEGKREIESTIDGASWYLGERRLIELYGNEGPSGIRLGQEVMNTNVWEQLAWRRMTIKTKCNGNPRTFDQEYPRDPHSCFLASGNPVFDTDALAHLQILARTPMQYGQLNSIRDRATWIPSSEESATFWRWEQPRVGCAYLITVDLAEGEDQTKGENPDRHSIIVLRRAYIDQFGIAHRMKVVARIRPPNRMPIYAVVDLVWLLHLYFGGCMVIPEMNNSGVAFILGARAKGIPIWQRKDIDPHSGKIRKHDGWRTTDTREYGGLRSAIIWRLHEVLRNKELDCYCPHIHSELVDFVDKAGRMEAASGHDDDVLSLAIGVFNIEDATTYAEPITEISLPPDLLRLEREEEGALSTGMAQRW